MLSLGKTAGTNWKMKSTPVRVTKENCTEGAKHYMWVYRTGRMYPNKQIVLYEYQPSRNANHPREFLKEFNGICVTDGYQVYHTLALKQIQAIYREDNKLADMSPENRLQHRQLTVKPLVDAYFAWVKQNLTKAPAKSKTANGFIAIIWGHDLNFIIEDLKAYYLYTFYRLAA